MCNGNPAKVRLAPNETVFQQKAPACGRGSSDFAGRECAKSGRRGGGLFHRQLAGEGFAVQHNAYHVHAGLQGVPGRLQGHRLLASGVGFGW